jgi:hypothetical protein
MTISNKQLARLAGLCYLLVIGTGLFSEVFVRQALRVPGDALLTAQNILANESLYRWGFTADLINFTIGLPSLLIIYILFKQVNKYLTALAIMFAVVQTAIIATNLLNQLTPLLILGNETYLNAFLPEQKAALVLVSLNTQAQGYAIGLVFFGVYCLIIGYLIATSHLVPKILGALYAIAGACYLVNSFTMFLSKDFDNPLFVYLAIPIFIGELSLCLWLLIKGVKE